MSSVIGLPNKCLSNVEQMRIYSLNVWRVSGVLFFFFEEKTLWIRPSLIWSLGLCCCYIWETQLATKDTFERDSNGEKKQPEMAVEPSYFYEINIECPGAI